MEVPVRHNCEGHLDNLLTSLKTFHACPISSFSISQSITWFQLTTLSIGGAPLIDFSLRRHNDRALTSWSFFNSFNTSDASCNLSDNIDSSIFERVAGDLRSRSRLCLLASSSLSFKASRLAFLARVFAGSTFLLVGFRILWSNSLR